MYRRTLPYFMRLVTGCSGNPNCYSSQLEWTHTCLPVKIMARASCPRAIAFLHREHSGYCTRRLALGLFFKRCKFRLRAIISNSPLLFFYAPPEVWALVSLVKRADKNHLPLDCCRDILRISFLMRTMSRQIGEGHSFSSLSNTSTMLTLSRRYRPVAVCEISGYVLI